MKSSDEIEKEIQNKGLTAPRITPGMLEDSIKSSEYHVFDGSQLTVCVLTLTNNFTVTGESACVSPENFDEEIGRKVAYDNAKDKLWALLGFSLAEIMTPTPCVDADLFV